MKNYDHNKIEKKWQKEWEKAGIYKTDEDRSKPKCYVLDMFPYPSGEGLHVGHPKGYIATDVYSRFKRMNGMNVLHPMGWDAFGLPAEQYAIKNKIHPRKAVEKNIARFKEQLSIIGLNYDWDKEINTTDPKYYKWTQWVFLKMLEKGLAYESYEPINWCSSCQTGLANEDLDGDKCERCGTIVEKKPMRQWVLRITDYADRMLADLDGLDWADYVKDAQRNWIGKSEGAKIKFKIQISNVKVAELEVFTTRPDTLFGATYMVLAPEHELVEKLKERISNWSEVEAYREEVKQKTEIDRLAEGREKTGVELRGLKAVNPANQEELPIYIADYVLANYGTGAIMSVPAHDERDHAFAKKFGLPIKTVIEPVLTQKTGTAAFRENETFEDSNGIIAIVKHWSEDKYLGLRWPGAGWGTFLTGGIDEGFTPEETVLKEIHEETGYKNARIVRKIANIHSRYYHEPKKLNRFGHAPTFYVELLNDEKDPVSEEETSKHEMLWLTKDELKDFLTAESHKQALKLLDSPLYSGEGLLINSGSFDHTTSKDAKKVITGYVGGKLTSTYKLRDWTFSRQRYWGEPIPVIHCEACGLKEWKPKYTINFYSQEIWEKILSGEKTIETRALNPEEPERYFGNVSAGEILRFVNKETGESRPYKVRKVIHFSSIEEIASADKELGAKIWADGKESHSLEEWKNGYAGLSPNYLEKIQKNGLVAWEIEAFTVTQVVPVSESELPVKLPDVEFYEPTGTGESPLANVLEWVNVKCPKCGGEAKRETNTMPQWAGSSWYYLRYIDPKNSEALIDKEKDRYWSPVNMYVGGMEHATRHLIYARFWHKFLFDIGVVSHPEPFQKLHTVGLILASDGRKMSKRWGNVVNPDDVVNLYGADTLRLYEMFMGPFEQSSAWSTESIIGPRRFLEKIWKIGMKVKENGNAENSALETSYHQMLKKVTEDIGDFKFNTAVSKMMIFVNELEKAEVVPGDIFKNLLKVLTPFTPHIADELWHELGESSFIYTEKWPIFDPEKAKETNVVIAVQVNGKVRATFEAEADIGEEDAKKRALGLRDVKKWLEGKEPKKVIYVKGKLVSVVV